MKKRILMVVESLAGGVLAYVSQLANDMCDDFDLYIVYGIRSQTPKNCKDYFDTRITLIYLENFGDLKSIKNDIRVINELRRLEKEIKPDIIHLHSSLAGGFGRLAYKGNNNIVIYTPHGYSHLTYGKNTLKGRIYKLLEVVLGKRNCITLTCCESENEEAKKFSKKTAFIETGINIKNLSEYLENIKPIKSEQFTVFSLGRICIQKQPELFNQIAELVPEAKFIWIGSGELKDKLTAPNIEITGWKSRLEALAISKSADVFVLCSLAEAIAMSLIEEMFIKKLCLVSNAIGNKSVIKNQVNGYVCNNAEQYADRIKEAMAKYPDELVQNAYDDVINIYNSINMKEKYIDFYSSLTSSTN